MDSSNGSIFHSQFSVQNDEVQGAFKECFNVFQSYLLQTHMSDIVRVLLEDEIHRHYSLKIDGSDLLEHYVSLTEVLFFNPDKVLKVFDRAFHSATCNVYGSHNLREHMSLKQYLHVRFTKLPSCPEIWRDRVPKSIDIGRFLVMEGTVIRTSSAKILEYKKEYMCAKCKNVFSLNADFQLHYAVPTPTSCPVNSECNGKKFVVVAGNDGTTGPKKCKDYQEIRVQEQVRKLSMGTIPRSLTIVLEDDLVDCCKPGDDIIIFGSVMCRWHPSVTGKPCDLELVLKANNVEVCNERHTSAKGVDFEELQDEFQCFWATYTESSMMKARNHILASLCPQVYGLYVVKLAVALVLAGGVQRVCPNGARVRGECHLLLVGDPGTGKSQFLKYAAKVTPRSVLTTGIGSSTAGLTVSAIRDGPHWTLEAGALVLADGGICCIDEFSGIKEHDRSAIHEAMEQQTISVAKAGLVCKLNTRTSILAATNPKLGKYDEASSVSFNIAMASPLLSRFDLVLVLIDEKNLHWDSVVADYLLLGEQAGRRANIERSDLWSLDQMQAYFGIIRQINPTLSSEADQVLRAYYRSHRQKDMRNAARTTIRLLESLIRLSEAHARLMFRNVVTIQDAVAAVTVVESSMQGGALLPTGSILHSCFPKDADAEYLKHARLVLQCLNLENLMPEITSLPTTQLPGSSTQNSRLPNGVEMKNPTLTQSSRLLGKDEIDNNPASVEGSDIFAAFLQSSSQSDEAANLNQRGVEFNFATPANRSTPIDSTVLKPQNFNLAQDKATTSSGLSSRAALINSNFPKAKFGKENRSIFQIESDESVFNFGLTSQEPSAKKSKVVNNLSVDTGFGEKSAATNTALKQSFSHHSFASKNSEVRPLDTTPDQSQISLFSIDPITTPKSLKNNPLISSSSANSTESNNSARKFLQKFQYQSQNNIFKIPDTEASFMFPDFCDIESAQGKSLFSGNNPSRDTAGNSGSKPDQGNPFSITLDPSVIEDICGEFDI